MAEASNSVQEKTPTSAKDSPNGAAGPSSSTDVSLAPTEDMSIHLSPRDSNKDFSVSAKLPKPAGKNIGLTGARNKISEANSIKRTKSKSLFSSGKEIKISEDKKSNEKCDMCDEFKVMRARCLNCQSSMCSSCVEHHRKMKISSDHELQNWDTYLRQNVPRSPKPIAKAKQLCKIHKDEKLQFYCKACLQPLCINCKLTKHEGHKTRDLYEEIAEQRDNLPFKLSQIKASFLPLLKQQFKELEDYDKQVSFNIKGTVENIEKRTKVMKDEIDRTSTKLVDTLKSKETRELAKIDNRRQTISSYIRSATTALNTGERIVQTGDDFEVMELYQNLLQMMKQMQELTKRKPGKVKYAFQDGQMTQQTLSTMFGSYIENGPKLKTLKSAVTRSSGKTKTSRQTPALQHVPEIHPRLLKTFTCKLVPGNKISAIAPVNETEAWISFGWTTNEIYLYNKDGFRRNKLQFRNPIDDIAVDRDGNLIASSFTGNVVRHVDKKLQIRDFFQCPLRCRGLAVSAAGEIIVCGVDMCTAIPPPVKCSIFKYTARGNKTGHLDGDKAKKIPIHPYRVAENIDGSIVISDWVNDKEGRVVVFSHDGHVRMVYYGNSNEDRNFLPYGICTDKYGHIIVGDIIKQEIHLLDIKGHFLRILLNKDDLDNERPYSLAVDSIGMLWVGNERAQIKIFRYLLNQSHIV